MQASQKLSGGNHFTDYHTTAHPLIILKQGNQQVACAGRLRPCYLVLSPFQSSI